MNCKCIKRTEPSMKIQYNIVSLQLGLNLVTCNVRLSECTMFVFGLPQTVFLHTWMKQQGACVCPGIYALKSPQTSCFSLPANALFSSTLNCSSWCGQQDRRNLLQSKNRNILYTVWKSHSAQKTQLILCLEYQVIESSGLGSEGYHITETQGLQWEKKQDGEKSTQQLFRYVIMFCQTQQSAKRDTTVALLLVEAHEYAYSLHVNLQCLHCIITRHQFSHFNNSYIHENCIPKTYELQLCTKVTCYN